MWDGESVRTTDIGREKPQSVKVSVLLVVIIYVFVTLNLGVQCPALIAPDNGNVHVGGRYPGNRADYSCNDGFSLKGVGWRKCQDNGQWTREAPTCESECIASMFCCHNLCIRHTKL